MGSARLSFLQVSFHLFLRRPKYTGTSHRDSVIDTRVRKTLRYLFVGGIPEAEMSESSRVATGLKVKKNPESSRVPMIGEETNY